jgi:AraC-like DNA-binding protein
MTRGAPVVATVLEPPHRQRIDAAAHGQFRSVHAETVRQALHAVRERPVHAVLLSPGVVTPNQLPGVVSLVQGFPGVRTVALLAGHDPAASERLLDLGACGVRRVVDLRARAGWQQLRRLVADAASPAAARILARVVPALGEATPECRRFFEFLVRLAPTVPTVRGLARRLGVGPSTLMSRFFRADVPSPKRYLGAVRLTYAAGLLESPGLSIADVAYRLEYSSPQSMGRHLRTVLGMTAGEFRRRVSFESALDDLVARLIVPHRGQLRTFRPLANGVADLGQVRL